MESIALLGTGLIGSGLAEAALKRGEAVTVYNRTKEKAVALASFGARVAESAADAVRGASRVHLALNDDAAVDAILAACTGQLGDAVVIDHSTTSAAGTRARATRLAAQGVAFLHAPVFMSPQACRDATGLMLVAGPQPVYERVAPALLRMTGSLKYLGERSDHAAAYKLFGNAMLISIAAGLADVFAMAHSLDLAPTDAFALFDSFNPTMALQIRGRRMSAGDYQASFELAMARKDVRLMLEAAADQPLAVLPAIAARMDTLIAQGHARDDLGILAIDAVPSRTS